MKGRSSFAKEVIKRSILVILLIQFIFFTLMSLSCFGDAETLFNSTKYFLQGGPQRSHVIISGLDGENMLTAWSILNKSTIFSIHCFNKSLAYAVEVDGTVYRADGDIWRYEHSLGYVGANAISMCSGDSVYISGGRGVMHYYNGAEWRVIPWDGEELLWGSDCSPDDNSTYVVGDGVVLRLQDGTISKVWRFDNVDFRAVKALHHGCAVAAGSGGAFWIYNGTTWTDHSLQGGPDFQSVWAVDRHRILAASIVGVLVEYYFGDFRELDASRRWTIDDIWGPSRNNLYACGINGTVVHYDGDEWKSIDTGTNIFIVCISGTSSENVYFAGNHASIFHYDGSTFKRMQVEIPFELK